MIRRIGLEITLPIHFICLLLGLTLSENVLGQNVSGSPYSVYGVGELTGRSSALNRAMSGTGIAVRDLISLNTVNPASYTSIQYPVTHTAELGFYASSDRYKTNKKSEKKNSGSLTGISYWFRIKPKWASTIGLSPYSQVSYNILSNRKFEAWNGDVGNKGEGGLNQVYFGNGYQITKNFSVGVNLSYIFGAITKTETIFSNESLNGTSVIDKTSLRKLNLDFGGQYSIAVGKNRLTIGIVGENKTRLRGTKYLDVIGVNGDTLDSNDKESVRVRLPGSIGGGVAYHSTRSILAVDVTWGNWADADLEENLALKDTYKFSSGYRYLGNPNGSTYSNILQFNSGFFYQNHYVVVKDTNLNSWGYTLGIGLPIGAGKGIINLNYNWSNTGTLTNGLIRQRSQSISIDIVFRDVWGYRKKLD